MPVLRRVLSVFLLVSSLLVGKTVADEKAAFYLEKIKPLLTQNCAVCHGVLKREAELRLDAGKFILKGSESGKIVVPGKPEESLLIHALKGIEDATRMPLERDPLSKEKIALIEKWIRQGAIVPENEPLPPDPHEHWAYRFPVKHAPPVSSKSDWNGNPIDAFLAAKHQELGLVPQVAAPKSLLLRRITLDLIGLPPTPEELQAFLKDNSSDAYDKVVEQLLARPQYGERWGRHWMDIWRYSDWSGYKAQLRDSARNIWRWRDWIIESLNEDKPYNRMIVEMLAADELKNVTAKQLRATGFLARNYYKFNRNVWLDRTIEHTGKAFLGITFNCARCHNHMYDPIAQSDYYRFRAIFEPHKIRQLEPFAGEKRTGTIPIAYDQNLNAKTYLFKRGNDKKPDQENPLDAGVPEFFSGGEIQVEPVSLPPQVYEPGLSPAVRKRLLEKAKKNLDKQIKEFTKAKKSLEKLKEQRKAFQAKPIVAKKPSYYRTKSGKPAKSWKLLARTDADYRNEIEKTTLQLAMFREARMLAEFTITSIHSRIAADDAKYSNHSKQEFTKKAQSASKTEKQVVVQKFLAELAKLKWERFRVKNSPAKFQAFEKRILQMKKKLATANLNLKKNSTNYAPLVGTFPKTSTGRRLALAKWIASKKNPLTARVAVNHIWIRHFGKPLVESVFDFGMNGKAPTHPKLLDWLAVDFMEHGWSMKHLHRLIVTSNAYRMDSTTRGDHRQKNLEIDPDNRFLWRMNARRLEAEVVRDCVLFVAGKLDPKMGGPEIDAKKGESTYRRSVYYRHAPEKSMLFLKQFDSASTLECYRRNETVVPQQALAMINSRLTLDQSTHLVQTLEKKKPLSDGEFVETIFQRILCRKPSKIEYKTCAIFLNRTDTSKKKNRISLVHVLLNHNEFVTIR